MNIIIFFTTKYPTTKRLVIVSLLLFSGLLQAGCATQKVWEKHQYSSYEVVQKRKAIAEQIYLKEDMPNTRFKNSHKPLKDLYIPYKFTNEQSESINQDSNYSGLLKIEANWNYKHLEYLLSDHFIKKIKLLHFDVREIRGLNNKNTNTYNIGAYLHKTLSKTEITNLNSNGLYISNISKSAKRKSIDKYHKNNQLILLTESYDAVEEIGLEGIDLVNKEFKPLITYPLEFEIIFYKENETETYVVTSMFGRMFATPFSVAFDVATSPVQLIIGLVLYFRIPNI